VNRTMAGDRCRGGEESGESVNRKKKVRLIGFNAYHYTIG